MKIKVPKMSLEKAVIIVIVLAFVRQFFYITKYSILYQKIEIVLLAVVVCLAINTFYDDKRSEKEKEK